LGPNNVEALKFRKTGLQRRSIFAAGLREVQQNIDMVEHPSQFRARFEAKGRFRDYLAAIPTSVIVRPFPALLGAATLLQREQG
jgi:glucokinase